MRTDPSFGEFLSACTQVESPGPAWTWDGRIALDAGFLERQVGVARQALCLRKLSERHQGATRIDLSIMVRIEQVRVTILDLVQGISWDEYDWELFAANGYSWYYQDFAVSKDIDAEGACSWVVAPFVRLESALVSDGASRVMAFVDKCVAPRISRLSCVRGFAECAEAGEAWFVPKRGDILFVVAAYVILNEPDKALEWADRISNRTGVRRKLAPLFERLRGLVRATKGRA